MANPMQPVMPIDPSATGGMGGMEEAVDTIGVPALVDGRTLAQFCQAIQQYADRNGLHEQAQEKIQDLLARLNKLQKLAQLCRLSVLGLPHACERVRDELECVAVDFPTTPICPPDDDDDMDGGDDANIAPAQLSAALDLMAGAAFVSKDDPAQRDRFIIGIVRAVEDAICFPVTYAPEAAAYLSGGISRHVAAQIETVIAIATSRFLEGDLACDPRSPEQVRARLETLACKWMRANPVTELLCALTGPRWDGALQTIQPSSANIGDEITLEMRVTCADQTVNPNDARAQVAPKDLKVLFCPRQPAKIMRYSGGQIVVTVPPGSRSGPIAVVRDFGLTLFGDIIYLLDRYACEYPSEWFNSVFTLIPMWQWAYPVAFGEPCIKIAFVPQQATVSAYSKYGLLGPTSTVQVNDVVAIYYQVDPPGSDAQTPVNISASSGALSNIGVPGAIGFKSSNPGDVSINFSWGTLTSTVVVHVVSTPA